MEVTDRFVRDIAAGGEQRKKQRHGDPLTHPASLHRFVWVWLLSLSATAGAGFDQTE
jgi:hypothetical protein